MGLVADATLPGEYLFYNNLWLHKDKESDRHFQGN